MAFLTLNGWEVSVAHEKAAEKFEIIGQGSRSFLGTYRDTRRAEKRIWSITTPPIVEATAEAVKGLVLGHGWHWNFNSDLYAENKGLAPDTGYEATLSATQTKFSSAYSCHLDGDAGAGANVEYDCGVTGDYTISVWQYDTGAAAWAHLVVVYDADTTTATKYINNSSGSTINCIVVAAGVVELEGEDPDGNNEDVYYDDLVICPYKWPAGLITAVYNGGTGLEFSGLPRLNMGGDITKTDTAIEVVGSLNGSSLTQGYVDGTWHDNLRTLTFDLIEV